MGAFLLGPSAGPSSFQVLSWAAKLQGSHFASLCPPLAPFKTILFSVKPEVSESKRVRERGRERGRGAHTVSSLSRKIPMLYMKTGKGKEAV